MFIRCIVFFILLSLINIPVIYSDEDNEINEKGKDHFWFGLSANLNLVHVNLTTRKYEMGFSPGIAYGLKWRPGWWTFTKSFLSIDMLMSAAFKSFDENSDPDYFDISFIPVLTIIDSLSAGVGFSYKLALKQEAKDTLEFIFSFSLSMSVGNGGTREVVDEADYEIYEDEEIDDTETEYYNDE